MLASVPRQCASLGFIVDFGFGASLKIPTSAFAISMTVVTEGFCTFPGGLTPVVIPGTRLAFIVETGTGTLWVRLMTFWGRV